MLDTLENDRPTYKVRQKYNDQYKILIHFNYRDIRQFFFHFKRDQRTENGKTIYLWFDGAQYWNFSYESEYEERKFLRYVCQMRVESSGELENSAKLSNIFSTFLNSVINAKYS